MLRDIRGSVLASLLSTDAACLGAGAGGVWMWEMAVVVLEMDSYSPSLLNDGPG